jgi:type IV secretory pathway VirB10-like protein
MARAQTYAQREKRASTHAHFFRHVLATGGAVGEPHGAARAAKDAPPEPPEPPGASRRAAAPPQSPQPPPRSSRPPRSDEQQPTGEREGRQIVENREKCDREAARHLGLDGDDYAGRPRSTLQQQVERRAMVSRLQVHAGSGVKRTLMHTWTLCRRALTTTCSAIVPRKGPRFCGPGCRHCGRPPCTTHAARACGRVSSAHSHP